MALSITTHCRYTGIRISEFRAIVKLNVGRRDIQHNDTQHKTTFSIMVLFATLSIKDSEHNDTCHKLKSS
jgi:hypothetical protein